MIDHFALLNEPRRPWLDPELLRAKFLTLSSKLHPDRTHNTSEAEKSILTERYSALHAAYDCLREPKKRLLHFPVKTGAPKRKVKVLVDGLQDAGLKSVEWYASTAPSGVYFYCLNAGSFSSVKKLMLVK